MEDAGFFYTQKGDRVICFNCGGGLRQWSTEDDPWQEHALHYEKCNYLRLMKGPEYITIIREKFGKDASGKNNGNENCSPSLPLQREEANEGENGNGCSENSPTALINELKNIGLNETRLCRICYTNEYNTLFLPCGHIAACAKCASSHNKCPLCREPLKQVLRIFLP